MENALYVGLSRQILLRREMDVIANNIANLDTTAFKVESMLTRTDAQAPARTLGGPNPVKFVTADGIARDFGQGALRTTGGAYDLAIDGTGFFQIQGAGGEELYTRDGRFRLDNTGRLVNQAGQPVLAEGGGEIQLDLERGPVTIGLDGSISQGLERVGKVAMVDFPALAALEKAGDNTYRNPTNAQPQPTTNSKMRQGMLEGSNVRPITEMTRMIEVSRAYESTAKLMDSEFELARRSVERLGRAN
jgi:flagellar basal-body rod protein FlgF